jgi:Na+/phosphate symporter
MLLAAMGGRRNARMLGMATFLYKLVGVVVFLPFISWANVFLDRLNFPMATNIVLAQVLIVVLNAAIFYATPDLLIHGSSFLLSFKQGTDLRAPIYLDEELLEFPSLAAGLLTREIIRLANYIEAFLQMLLFPEKGEGELKNLLPDGIKELTEACEQYMYAIRPPSIAEDHEAGREYRTISYAMISLREASRLVTGRFRDILERQGVGCLANEVGIPEWDKMTTALLETVRNAFHSFSLGDANLAQRAIAMDEIFDESARHLRSRILLSVEEMGRREESALLDFVILAGRVARSALEVARGDVAVGTKVRQ